MKKLTKTDLIILAALAAAVLSLLALSVKGPSRDTQEDVFTSFAEYNGKVIGSAVGTTYDQAILANIPQADLSYFYSYGDMLAALESRRIDAFCADEPVVRYMMLNSGAVTYLPGYLEAYDYAFAFSKSAQGAALRDQFNAFLAQAREDGTLEAVSGKWFESSGTPITAPDLSSLPGPNGTLKLATESANPPFSCMVDGKAGGFEIDTAFLFCQKMGYGLEVINYNFDAILPALQSGLCDFAACSITPTPERAESVYFSLPHLSAGAVLAVRKTPEAGTAPNFFMRLADSFQKNFLRENRWKLILQGIGVTCLITCLSVLIGSVLAFLLCLFRRTDSLLAGRLADLYVKLLQGTPMIVLLMILYYIVFARSGINAIFTAVLAFSMNFSAYASEIMRSGLESIDSGQREAALALGYTERQAFFRYILPQAAVRFLPVYRGEVISLLKSTSIVGYISIQDLTKMSDIIRSRTYEAFFPLIATALIYFLLAYLISLLLGALLLAVDPRSHRNTGKEAKDEPDRH